MDSSIHMSADMDYLISEYGDSLLRMAFLYLRDEHLAQDAVQDTMLKVFMNYSEFNGEASEKTWIMRIAINVCKDYLRKAWRKHIDAYAALERIPAPDNIDSTIDDTLIKQVMQLPSKYKEVILLFYYQGMKISEIAETLHIPDRTVSTRLKRARDRLKANLKGWYYDE